eukprot:4493713-Pyramimonas_sp.AAC.1
MLGPSPELARGRGRPNARAAEPRPAGVQEVIALGRIARLLRQCDARKASIARHPAAGKWHRGADVLNVEVVPSAEGRPTAARQ